MNVERSTAILRAFGGRIRLLRRQAGLSTAQLARRAQMTVEVLDTIEFGRHDTVGIDEVFQLAEALSVHPAELFDGDPYPHSTPTAPPL